MNEQTFLDWVVHHQRQVMIDLSAGTISGMQALQIMKSIHCVAAHPLDTVKVRMQSSNFKLFSVIQNTFKDEGPRAFFKGLKFPLIAVPLINATVFSSYEFCKRLLNNYFQSGDKYWKTWAAGMFTGITASLITTPIELAKCQLQTQKSKLYTGPFDCIRQVYKQEGFKGPFKGMFVTLHREIPGYAVYFTSNQIIKDVLLMIKGTQTSSNFDLLVAGGFAGIAGWTISYPQDTIKTLLQTERIHKSAQSKYKPHSWIPDGGYFDCRRQIIANEGYQALWKGYSACLIRAFYANAIVFYTYEWAKEIILKQYHDQE